MLSENELENYYRLLRSFDEDSIKLAIGLSRAAKVTGLDSLYRELIHICNNLDHPNKDIFNSIEKGRKNPKRILFVNQCSSITLKNNGQLPLLEKHRHFNSIRKISLWSIGLNHFPKALFFYPEVEELNLGNNIISKLPNGFSVFRNLKKLNLIANSFSTFPEALLDLESLEELQLGINYIKGIPESITRLKNLKTLSLSDNKLKTLPSSIFGMKQLKTISLGKHELDPSVLVNLKEALPKCKIY